MRYTFHRLSDKIKDTVTKKLMQGLEPAEIVRQNTDQMVSEYMKAHGILDRDQALASLEESRPSRDFYLSYADVDNIKRQLDRKQWRFSENNQQSLRLFARSHPEDVLLFQEQAPIEGTPDYAYIQQRQAAGQGQHHQVEQGRQEEQDATERGAFFTEMGVAGSQGDTDQLNSDPSWCAADADISHPGRINLDRSGQASTARSTSGDFTFSIGNWTSFEMVIMKESNIADAIRWGHKRTLQLDSTFGSNSSRFPLSTLVIVDDHGNGIPIAYLVSSQETTESMAAFLTAVRNKVRPPHINMSLLHETVKFSAPYGWQFRSTPEV
jgi:hypothetical protein